MPIFEYACPSGHSQDEIRKIAMRDDPLTCECGQPMQRIEISRAHVAPDGVYSYAPNIGNADRFERQREAIKSGTKTIPRIPDVPRDHRDGQLSGRQRY